MWWAADCKRAQESCLMSLKGQTGKGTVEKTSIVESYSLERTMRNLITEQFITMFHTA